MIEGIVGLPGEGKTLWAVRCMVAHGKANEKARKAGKRVQRTMSNLVPRTGHWDFGLWQDIIAAGNCKVWIDEAHNWFASREFHKTTQEELSIFQQSRKEGLDLVWIAQHQMRVDVAIRELTAFIWKTRKVGPFLVLRKFQPDEPKRVLQSRIWRLDPAYFQHYWTEQRIGTRDGKGYSFGASSAYGGGAVGAELVYDRGRLILQPNLFRIEGGRGPVYVSANSPRLSLEIASAVEWAHRGGFKGLPEDLVRGIYRAEDGRMTHLDADMTIQPREDDPTIIQKVRAAFYEEFAKPFLDLKNHARSHASPRTHLAVPVVLGVKPAAANQMARADSVSRDGSSSRKALRPGQPGHTIHSGGA